MSWRIEKPSSGEGLFYIVLFLGLMLMSFMVYVLEGLHDM